MSNVSLSKSRLSLSTTPGLDVAAAAVLFLAICGLQQGQGALPGQAYWEGWSDQSKYIESARAFASGDFAPTRHWYPLLYPLALAPFVKISAFAAAALVDALGFALAYLGFRDVAARFEVPRLHAFLLFVATTLLGKQLSTAWIAPWTTTASAALIWLALARVARPRDDAPAARGAFVSGLLLGAIPLCRPADAVVSVILGAVLLAGLVRRAGRGAEIPSLAAGAGLIVAAYAALHLAIYGPHASDYMKLSAAYGFDLPRLAWKAQTLLVYPGPFFPNGVGIVARFPWLIVGIAGLLVAVAAPERRRVALPLAAATLAYVALMLCYEDLTASNLWTFRLIHYFKWTMPAFALFGYDLLRRWGQRPRLSLAALVAVAASTTIQYRPVAVGPDDPASLIVFKAPAADPDAIATGRSVLVDARGSLRNLLDFHQFPDGRGFVYAQASRRNFAGGEVWRDTRAEAWPPMQPLPAAAPRLLGDFEVKPLARYRAALSLGWPCWLATCPNRLP